MITTNCKWFTRFSQFIKFCDKNVLSRYFVRDYYWNKEDFENYVKPAVEKIFNEKFADYKIDKTKAPTKVG